MDRRRELLSCIDSQRDRLVVAMLFETGCTVSELVKIRIKDIRGNILTIPGEHTKNRRIRRIEMPPKLSRRINDICRGRKKTECLFRSKQSQGLSTRRIEQIIVHYAGICGLTLSPRKIRKEYIKNQLRHCSPEEAQSRTGVLSIKTRPAVNLDRFKPEFQSIRDGLIFKILAETGCTVTELVNIRVQDIKKDKILIKDRSICVSKILINKIKTYTTDKKKHLFGNTKPLSQRRVQQILTQYSKKVHLKVTPRIIRNSYAYRLHSKGQKIQDIEKKMGIRISPYTHGLLE